jgi:hypothetical protein
LDSCSGAIFHFSYFSPCQLVDKLTRPKKSQEICQKADGIDLGDFVYTVFGVTQNNLNAAVTRLGRGGLRRDAPKCMVISPRPTSRTRRYAAVAAAGRGVSKI